MANQKPRGKVIYDAERDKGCVRIVEYASEPVWIKRLTLFGRHYYLGRAY